MNHITLQVKGMSCGHCVNAIEGALREIGAEGKVDLASGTVDVTYEPAQVSIEAVKEAIEEQGYDVA
ncbi:copper ion binding protein [Paenibacillus arenilitoris]|uniref:Heavy-metal-associated domain-containing protein n=1 Tax=Paenibacillus arenilitoris TaxID=2772299 RepID=A0A927CML3_9BACL|nr:copper ion binding protein [Paenibacillus arenilitoris]MBD2868616.1 heavy-metal-associated domain-containing protein [Paenibacillus arenilitoris]